MKSKTFRNCFTFHQFFWITQSFTDRCALYHFPVWVRQFYILKIFGEQSFPPCFSNFSFSPLNSCPSFAKQFLSQRKLRELNVKWNPSNSCLRHFGQKSPFCENWLAYFWFYLFLSHFWFYYCFTLFCCLFLNTFEKKMILCRVRADLSGDTKLFLTTPSAPILVLMGSARQNNAIFYQSFPKTAQKQIYWAVFFICAGKFGQIRVFFVL